MGNTQAGPSKHTTCEGEACLNRESQLLPRPRGYAGPTGPRCPSCRNDELINAVVDKLKELRRDPEARELVEPQPPRRLPSHVDIGVLLASHGHPPVSIGRICKALSRAGIPHCEDYHDANRKNAGNGGGTRPQAHTCPKCRNPNSHKGHRRDATCAESTIDATPPAPQPTRRLSTWTRGSRRALLAAEAGPDYRPCPHYQDITNTVVAAARDAMRALTASPVRYPG